MVGNLAGAFSNIYFLAMRLPKNAFIGTAAWLFIINIFKVPFHIWSWQTINKDSFFKSLELIPFEIFWFNIRSFYCKKKINENSYRKLILLFTALGGAMILFN